jgi:hypothetical protein
MFRFLFGNDDDIPESESQQATTEGHAQSEQKTVKPSTKDARMPDKMKYAEKPEKTKAEEIKSSDQQNKTQMVESLSSPSFQRPTDRAASSTSSSTAPIRRPPRTYMLPASNESDHRRHRSTEYRSHIGQQNIVSASQPAQPNVSSNSRTMPGHSRQESIAQATGRYSQTQLSHRRGNPSRSFTGSRKSQPLPDSLASSWTMKRSEGGKEG